MSVHTGKGVSAEEIIRSSKGLPVSFYNFRDHVQNIISDTKFIDAVMILLIFISASIAIPYYPAIFVVVLSIVLFIASMKHPFLGMGVLAALIFPVLMYQSPGIGWIYAFVFTAAMVFGFINYRSIILAYLLISLALSYIGKLLFIPFMILAPLLIGFKRSAIMIIIVFVGIISFSATMGIQNNAYILYNASDAHSAISSGALNTTLQFTTVSGPRLTVSTFISGTGAAFKRFMDPKLLADITAIFAVLVAALLYKPVYTIQFIIVVALFFSVETVAIRSRSKYKGARASTIGVVYPIVYGLLLAATGKPILPLIPLLSFVLAPLAFFLMELYNIDIVKALEVKKHDIRMKFGEAFEDLQAEKPSETFDDIADYTTVKDDMMRSIISPIEQRGVSRAYNVKPVKGVLLFGPPGNGKTMMMRALSREIHNGFFRMSASDIVASQPGESERKISRIFAIAKKSSPCILFIDEIDSIAGRRDVEMDEVHKHLMSQLLEELDGFQKLERVIVVGATNRPDAIDPAILRPGRFDRSIYMPLPDFGARSELFRLYLKRLPISRNIDVEALAKNTERFSCVDIRNICESTSQRVAREAIESHKLLDITYGDLIKTIKSTKPSTRIADVEQYTRFRDDFERTHNVIAGSSKTGNKAALDRIVGYSKEKDTISSAIDLLTHPELAKKYGVKGTNGILMYGPAGTGKTMMMRAVAGMAPGVTMIELDSSEIMRGGPTEATSKLKEYFYRAKENKPAILFIDEIDGIVGSRTGSEEMYSSIISEFLKQMDGMRGSAGIMVIASTNRPDVIDPAILRPGRFDRLLYIGPPTAPIRKKMFINFLRNAPLDAIDFDRLAEMTEGFTGADIEGVCNEAKRISMNVALKERYSPNITQKVVEDVISGSSPSAPDDVLEMYKEFRKAHGRD